MTNSIMALPYEINNRLRYGGLGLSEHSTRADLWRVRARIPAVRGIGRVALATIDDWLTGDVEIARAQERARAERKAHRRVT